MAASQVRFAGYGGQGIALMGHLTGRAAAIADGKEAVFTQSYGPEARGGASAADVIIATEPIDYPLVTKPDVLVVMFQEAYKKYAPGLNKAGLLLADADLVTPDAEHANFKTIPATAIAEELGKRIAANIVMLGFFAAVTGLVSRKALEETLRASLKPSILELNLKALDRGFAYAAGKVPAGSRT